MKAIVSSIKVGERVRKELGDLDALKKSLEKHGLIHPILINSRGELIAGYRRLTAAVQLGWKEIDAKVVDPEREIDLLELEMEENMARKDFTYEEMLEGLEKKKKLLRPGILARIWRSIKALFGRIFPRK